MEERILSRIYMIGKSFGQWFVKSYIPHTSTKRRKAMFNCVCSCGNEGVVDVTGLKNGHSKRCRPCSIKVRAAKQITHGKSGTPIWSTWQGMIARCTKSKNSHWSYYGGRGITVCDRWLKFENFLEDMGDKPEGKSLDRIDNDKGYSPENCRWATRSEQYYNQRGCAICNCRCVMEKYKKQQSVEIISKTSTSYARV